MKIVLAFDSFKGSLSAEEAVAAAREGVRSACDADIVELPLADGGEGTTDVLSRQMGATWVTCEAHDALMRPVKARYAVAAGTAIMEMAEVAGLTLLGESERDPMRTTTYGVGEMMLDAVRRGCPRILIGIGGSATNDGGTGMLASLGVRMRDAKDNALTPIGGNLTEIEHIDWSGVADLGHVTIDVICDVDNPLCGPDGAAHVYARQKGASDEDVVALDRGLRHWAAVAGGDAQAAGSGAAGGLGYGLRLLGARLRSGIDVMLEAVSIDRHLHDADMVITGEGSIDRQTLNGKLPYGILLRAQAHDVPVAVLAGRVADAAALTDAGFTSVHSINPPGTPHSEAMRPETARRNLRDAVRRLVTEHISNIQQH